MPVFGKVFQGLADAFNALGNIGADMPPAVRAKAKKVVVSAIIVTQIAAQASTMAAASAARTASGGGATGSGSGSSSGKRRIK